MDYKELINFKEQFEFIFDWRFLHELIDTEERSNYLKEVNRLLKPRGKYLSVSFSGDSEMFGKDSLRKAPTGITLHFLTLQEATEMFEKRFKIIEKKHIKVSEKPNLRVKTNFFLMEKK